ELAARFGRLGLEACLADAIDAAERGFAVGARAAASWAAAAGPSELWPPTSVPPELMPPPAAGDRVRLPELAATLRTIARDGADVWGLLAPDYVERRRREQPRHTLVPAGGTVYLCVVDGDGMAVSFIQSLFARFGSGLVAPGTGVVLQNRGACFALQGGVVAGKRRYHTIIPGLILKNGELVGPFGVMGGFIQAQAHVRLVSALVDKGLEPQAALDQL